MEKTMKGAGAQLKERRKKFLLFLPAVVIPFTTMLLWSVGIVGTADGQVNTTQQKTGFNVKLPAARQAKDSNWNKLQYYAQADKDSEKLRSLLRNDHADSGNIYTAVHMNRGSASGLSINADPKEQLIEQKIAALNKKLSRAVSQRNVFDPENSSYANEVPDPPPAQKRAALQRMKEEQQWAAQPAKPDDTSGRQQADPELKQLDGMLDKVLDIQHPERVQQQLQQRSEENKKLVYPVSIKTNTPTVSLLQSKDRGTRGNTAGWTDDKNRLRQMRLLPVPTFYGLKQEMTASTTGQAIAATIPEEQILLSGATVKLQLCSDVYIRGILIPGRQLIYGTASLKGERLNITISSIGYNGQLLPVSLSVYDIDGQQGLYIPGTITRDVAKQSADQGIQTLNFGSYDASIGAQAANAGIQAAKTLIGKKVRLIKVTVRSGYKVWLSDMNNKDDQ